MSINSTVTNAVHDYLAKSGISQNKLAHALGYQQSRLNRRMNGKIPWTLVDLEKLAALGIHLPEARFDD